MPDIETLGVLMIDDKTIGRQLISIHNADKRQRNCQCEGAVQTEDVKLESHVDNRQDVGVQEAVQAIGGTPEGSTNVRQDVDTQSQHSADNTTEPSVITNPLVTGNQKN